MALMITTTTPPQCLSQSGLKFPSTANWLKAITKTPHYYRFTLGQRFFYASDTASCIRVKMSKVSKPSYYDIDDQSSNPFLTDFDDFPPFDVIKPEHVVPGIGALLEQFNREFYELQKSLEPTWQNVGRPLWGTIQSRILLIDTRLDEVWGTIIHLKSVNDTPEFRVAFSQVQSEIIVFKQKMSESKFKVLGMKKKKRKRLAKVNNIEHDLVKLSQKFEENVFDKFKMLRKEITEIKLAINIYHENGTDDDALKHLNQIDTDLTSSGDFDNTLIIEEILELRYEKAKLLGFNNFAEWKMRENKATVDKPEELLEELRIASWDLAIQEMEELKQFAMSQGVSESNNLSDFNVDVWRDRLIISKYEIDLEDKCEYFSLPNVLDGLFHLLKTIFGIIVQPSDGLAPVWNKDVRFYRVDDISTGSSTTIAYFYFDPYSRLGKHDGAWVNEVVVGNSVLDVDGHSIRLPIFHMICDIDDDGDDDDKPNMMTFEEVKMVFHEFGHLLHDMLKKDGELERDAIELPSQFMENWCYHKETFVNIGKHYETGENPPEGIYEKFLDFRTFRSGCRTLKQLKHAIVDLELHTKYVPGGSESIYDISQRVSQRTQIHPPLEAHGFLCSFTHIFAGGYAAEYYSYLWSEVLSADAFSAFEEAGLNDEKSMKETGKRFRKTILSLEGNKGALKAFVDFRGREPCIQAFLKQNGMLSVTASDK